MMKKSYILIILISFLVVSPKLYAQVACPCNFEAVPKDTACWKEPFGNLNTGPDYTATVGEPPKEVCFVVNIHILGPEVLLGLFVDSPVVGQGVCSTAAIGLGDGCTATTAEEVDLTPEEVKACQCELLAYTTALNEVDGISVSGGPPYECFDVDCPPPPTQPPVANVPTLSGWGLMSLAVVLGILGLVGFLVMRRRKVSA
jgi:hypothetical protein